VTNALGFDTGLAIADTSKDKFVAPSQNGACTLNFYNAGAPPPPAPPITFGVDTAITFFDGNGGSFNGIPGGPFGTAAGTDTLVVKDNFMFTVGGVINVPVFPGLSVGVTGGFAELNQTVKFNCTGGGYCGAVPAATPFTASDDTWIPGAYFGGKVSVPIPLVPGATLGVDVKRVLFGNQTSTPGNPQRILGVNTTPNMTIVTGVLQFPISVPPPAGGGK